MKGNVKRTAISISLFGETAVGKTNICSTFLGLEFKEQHLATIGIEKMISEIVIDTGDKLKIKLWDTAGQERFKSISVKNLRYSQGAVVVFDLTKQESFNKVTEWLKRIRDVTPNMPIGLFGNKSDLKDLREVKQEDIDELCNKEKLVYFETSAKENIGIREGFTKVASLGFKMDEFETNKGKQLKDMKIKDKKKKC